MPMFASAPLPDVETIRQRLQVIFPEGLADRNYVTREVAAQIVFTMLYVDAIVDQGHMLGPVHVYRMGDTQAALQSDAQRATYREGISRRNARRRGTPWMRDNSREAIRDESLRSGLVLNGAVIEDRSLPTTSSRPRYALERGFAALFTLADGAFPEAAATWRTRHLAPAELARIQILHARPAADTVLVRVPSGETRSIASGPSSQIMRAVVQEFAPRFLEEPRILWMSDSRDHVVLQDDALMRAIGLPIAGQRLLPDLVLADTRPPIKLIFVEIVATDGPFTNERRDSVLRMTDDAGFECSSVHFVSAFSHRDASPLKRRFAALAENSFAWCMSEPELLIWIARGQHMPLNRTAWRATPDPSQQESP